MFFWSTKLGAGISPRTSATHNEIDDTWTQGSQTIRSGSAICRLPVWLQTTMTSNETSKPLPEQTRKGTTDAAKHRWDVPHERKSNTQETNLQHESTTLPANICSRQ
jgi:hypothetical protein